MKIFNELKLDVKIFLACLVLLALLAGVAGQNIFTALESAKSFQSIYGGRFAGAQQLNNMQKNIMQIRIEILRLENEIKNGNSDAYPRIFSVIGSSISESEESLSTFKTYANGPEQKESIAQTEKKFTEMKSMITEIEKSVNNNTYKETDMFSARWINVYKMMIDSVYNLYQEHSEQTDMLIAKQRAFIFRMMIIAAIIGIISFPLGIVVAVILKKSISAPVKSALKFARVIAEGDLRERIDIFRKDEFGELADALNTASENLEKIVEMVYINSRSIASAAEEIASGNENLSRRTSEQASALEEIASAMEQTAATVKKNAENAGNAGELIKSACNISDEGKKISHETIESINEINKSSKKISEIISLMNDISFQTNLLALNAAVEAARAGKQGRGFAVVAAEVKNLAQKSANAAKEISVLIQDTIDKVETGTELVYKSSDILKKVVESMNTVQGSVLEIASASSEQHQGIDQINMAVSEIDSMTQQNAALVEEAASASEQLKAQSRILLGTVGNFKFSSLNSNENPTPEIKETIDKQTSAKPALQELALSGKSPVVKNDKPPKQTSELKKEINSEKIEQSVATTKEPSPENKKVKKKITERRKIQDVSDTNAAPAVVLKPNDLKKALSIEGFEEF